MTTVAADPPLGKTFGGLLNEINSHASPQKASGLAIDFLKLLDTHGRHNLVAYDPNGGGWEGRTFQPGQWREIAEWIDARDGRLNLYFSANEPKPNAPNKKLAKDDIARIRALFVDIDPVDGEPLDAEQKRLRKLAVHELPAWSAPPSVAWDTGGGVQAMWFLDGVEISADARRLVEDLGRGAARMVGGDAVQNIDRIGRLPGTVNIPDAKKRAKGRVVRRGAMLFEGPAHYTSTELSRHIAPVAAPDAEDSSEAIASAARSLDMALIRNAWDYDELSDDLRGRFEVACVADPSLARLWETGDPNLLGDDKSGSGYRAALAVRLGRAGNFNAQDYGCLAYAWEHSVQAGDDREQKLSARAIARDWVRIGEPNTPEARAGKHFVEPGPTASPSAMPTKRALKYTDFVTLLTEEVVEEPDYIEDGFAGPGNFILIAGPPKAQKSFLTQEIVVACATGGSFLDTFNVPRPLRVFYLQAEMNRKLLRKRAREMTLLSAADRELLAKNLIVSERFHMILNEAGVAAAAEAIKAAFPDGPPDIIAIDPLVNVFDKDNENDNTQMMQFLIGRIEPLRQLVNPMAAVVMVHHAAKKSVEELAKDPFAAIRGGGALRGYYDSAIFLYRKSEDGKTRRIHFELRSGESPSPIDVELIGGRFQKAKTPNRVPQRREAIARAVVGVLGGRRHVLLKDVQAAIGAALQDAKLATGTSRPSIQQNVIVALSTPVEIEYAGQSVLVAVEKAGPGAKAPWQIVVSDRLSGRPDVSDASDVSTGVFA